MADTKSMIVRSNGTVTTNTWIDLGHSRLTGDTQLRMTVKDDRIIFGTHSLREGVTLNRKKWCRWETNHLSTYVVKELKNGERHLNLYNRNYYKSGGRTVSTIRDGSALTYATLSGTLGGLALSAGQWVAGYDGPTVQAEIVALMERNGLYVYDGGDTDNQIFRSMFPAISLWYPNTNFNGRSWSFSRMTSALRQSTIEEFIAVQFGRTRYRKDLVKALLAAPLPKINQAALFTGVVPVDWQITALRDLPMPDPAHTVRPYYVESREVDRLLRSTMRGMTDPRKRSLMYDFMVEANYYLVSDTFRMLRDRRHQEPSEAMLRARTVTELHDAMSYRPYRDHRAARNTLPYTPPPPPVNEVIKTNKHIDSINAIENDEFKFVCAVDTDMMHAWSDAMGNCIRTYTSRAVKHKGIYIGVYREDKLYANIELGIESEGVFTVKQILGRFNEKLEDQYRNTILDALRTAVFIEVEKIKQAWGGGNYVANALITYAGNPTATTGAGGTLQLTYQTAPTTATFATMNNGPFYY